MNARERRDAALRREGIADAVVLLVAKRVVPTMTAHEWADRLGVTSLELQHAVDRFKARVKPPPKATRALHSSGPQTCPTCSRECADRRGLAAHIRTTHTTATCDQCGLVTTLGGLGPHRRFAHPPTPGAA